MKQVIVMRGIPGAGKDTIGFQMAGLLLPAAWVIVSADQHFTDREGNYRFNPAELSEAHASCFRRYVEKLHELDNPGGGMNSVIVVSNTNIHAWECAPYMMAAQAYGWDCKIVTVFCPPRIAYERGVHGVPYGTVARMEGALYAEHDKGNFPKHWKMEEVQNG